MNNILEGLTLKQEYESYQNYFNKELDNKTYK